jgi:hypothetical protein
MSSVPRVLARTRAFHLVVAALLGACGGEAPHHDGVVHTSVALTTTAQITRVAVAVAPAGAASDLAWNPATTSWTGSLVVAPGRQTVTATAYAGAAVVATGSADVVVVAGATADVVLTLLDTTGPGVLPRHSPVVTSFVVARTSLAVGESMAVAATGLDGDGDALAWAWTAAPPACGTFARPADASTTFTAAAAGACTITATLTAGGAADARSTAVTISPATGTLRIQGRYVPYPRITGLTFQSGSATVWAVDRGAADATCRTPFHKGTTYQVTIGFDPITGGSLTLLDTCGGAVSVPALPAVASQVVATWTPAVDTGACIVTAQLTINGLVDRFPVVLLAAP